MASEPGPKDKLFEFQQSLLTKEIDYIHSQISHFDTLSFQIKGWAVTLWAAIIAFGSSQTTALVISASIPVMITFWILDTFFKQYQRRFITRLGIIESFLDSADYFKESGLHAAFEHRDFGRFPLHDPIARRTRTLHVNFDRYYRTSTKFWKCLLIANISYFYLLLVASSLIIVFTIF